MLISDGRTPTRSSRSIRPWSTRAAPRCRSTPSASGSSAAEADARFKLGRFSTETGGTSYYIEQARDLQRVYDDIQTELRSQYILGIYPPDVKPGKWHEVTVQVSDGKAKTLRGYYP